MNKLGLSMDQTKTVFEIPEVNMFALSQKIEALNKKAKRLKCEPITTRVLGVEKRKERVCLGYMTLESAPDMAFETITRTYFTVEVLGAAPKLPGWTFLGTLQHEKTGNVVRSVPGFEIPESYRMGGQKCDHCKTQRNRKDTYIVRSDAGEVKQVGHNCVRDFLGNVSPQALALFAQFLKEMEGCGGSGFGGSGERSMSVETFLDFAAECVLQFGFVSSTAARAYAAKAEAEGGHGNIDTTASKTWRYLFPTPEMRKSGDLIRPSEAAIKLAAEALEWVKGLEVKSNYEHNLKITLGKEFLTHRDGGIAASAIGSYQRHIGKLAERKAKERHGANSNYFGEIGKRAVYTLTVEGEHAFESQFGSCCLYRMRDEQGNIAVWFTGSGSLEVGQTYKMKCTVKKHDLYKGTIKQTVLNRCTIVPEPKQMELAK